jgi:hypothetical protein
LSSSWPPKATSSTRKKLSLPLTPAMRAQWIVVTSVHHRRRFLELFLPFAVDGLLPLTSARMTTYASTAPWRPLQQARASRTFAKMPTKSASPASRCPGHNLLHLNGCFIPRHVRVDGKYGSSSMKTSPAQNSDRFASASVSSVWTTNSHFAADRLISASCVCLCGASLSTVVRLPVRLGTMSTEFSADANSGEQADAQTGEEADVRNTASTDVRKQAAANTIYTMLRSKRAKGRR